jgi:hypothetical protein
MILPAASQRLRNPQASFSVSNRLTPAAPEYHAPAPERMKRAIGRAINSVTRIFIFIGHAAI